MAIFVGHYSAYHTEDFFFRLIRSEYIRRKIVLLECVKLSETGGGINGEETQSLVDSESQRPGVGKWKYVVARFLYYT